MATIITISAERRVCVGACDGKKRKNGMSDLKKKKKMECPISKLQWMSNLKKKK